MSNHGEVETKKPAKRYRKRAKQMRAPLKVRVFGGVMLAVILSSFVGGYLAGADGAKRRICGDLIYYYENDLDIIRVRSCGLGE